MSSVNPNTPSSPSCRTRARTLSYRPARACSCRWPTASKQSPTTMEKSSPLTSRLQPRWGRYPIFAKPYHSWERGLNEHTNGLFRQYFPKGSDLSIVSDTEVQRVEDKLNSRPRKILGYRTPREVFFNAKNLSVCTSLLNGPIKSGRISRRETDFPKAGITPTGKRRLPRRTLEPDIKPGWILGLSDGLLGNGLDTVQVTGHIGPPTCATHRCRRSRTPAVGRRRCQ